MSFLQKLWSSVSTYAIAIAAGAFGVLLIAVRVLSGQNRRLRKKIGVAEATRDHAIDVLEQDMDINEQEDIHLAEALRELNDEGHSTELDDPNDWEWVSDDSD